MHGYTRPADATGLSDAYARYRDPDGGGRRPLGGPRPRRRAGRLLDEAGWRADATGVPPRARRPAAGADPGAARGLLRLDRRRRRSPCAACAGSGSTSRLRAVRLSGLVRAAAERATSSCRWPGPICPPRRTACTASLMSTETVRPLGEAGRRELAPLRPARGRSPAAPSWRPRSIASESCDLVAALQHLFVEHAPAIPLFPGPAVGRVQRHPLRRLPRRPATPTRRCPPTSTTPSRCWC